MPPPCKVLWMCFMCYTFSQQFTCITGNNGLRIEPLVVMIQWRGADALEKGCRSMGKHMLCSLKVAGSVLGISPALIPLKVPCSPVIGNVQNMALITITCYCLPNQLLWKTILEEGNALQVENLPAEPVSPKPGSKPHQDKKEMCSCDGSMWIGSHWEQEMERNRQSCSTSHPAFDPRGQEQTCCPCCPLCCRRKGGSSHHKQLPAACQVSLVRRKACLFCKASS